MGHETFNFDFARQIDHNGLHGRRVLAYLDNGLTGSVQKLLRTIDVVLMGRFDEGLVPGLLLGRLRLCALLVLGGTQVALDQAQVVGVLPPGGETTQLAPLRGEGDDFAHGIEQQVDVGWIVHMGFNDKGVAAPTQGLTGLFFTNP